MNFDDLLTALYLQNPCAVQPNALWKTFQMTAGFEKQSSFEQGKPTCLMIANPTMLHTWWHSAGCLPDVDLKAFHMMILHQQYYEKIDAGLFQSSAYFRVLHPLQHINQVELPMHFSFVPVDVRQDCAKIATFINQCYQHIQVDEGTVNQWQQTNVFDPALWVWVIDQRNNQAAALGLADVDEKIGEGSLEWIQVHPQYQHQGIAQALVNHLLMLLKSKVAFATVSGEVGNASNPEKLYRRCGFVGTEIWHVLRRVD